MNVDEILHTLSGEHVDHLLIGGMNFLLRHVPELTFDVDIWVRDDPENLERLNRALRVLGGEWGPTESDWSPVPHDWQWLRRQCCYCLTTAHGALDVFREVRGSKGVTITAKPRPSRPRHPAVWRIMRYPMSIGWLARKPLKPSEQKPRRMEVLAAAIKRKKPL